MSGGHNSFGLTVSNVRVNMPDAAPADPRRRADREGAPGAGRRAEDRERRVLHGWRHARERRRRVPRPDHCVRRPLNEARSLAVIREIKRAIPEQADPEVVSSHHHWDHLGGLRAYVAKENVTIVLQKNNLPTRRGALDSAVDAAAGSAGAVPAGRGLGGLHLRERSARSSC